MSRENHKKAIAITASCRANKGRLTDIYYRILEDQPSAIINAYEALYSSMSECPECHVMVDAVGAGGACIACDPRGFDGLY